MTSVHGRFIVVAIAAFALTASAYAQSPREQLQQMVEQLQKSPNDNALRERIIRLAPTLKAAPALPDTAISFEGRAQFAFRSAKSEADLLAAAQEYEKAVAAAPWVPGYYSDLCTIYEKAGKFADAKRHCGFFLIGLADPAQVTDVKRRIAGLEYGIEKANSPQTEKAAKPAGPDYSGKWVDEKFDPLFVLMGIEKDGDGWIIRYGDKEIVNVVKAQGRQLWAETSFYKFHLILSQDSQTLERVRTQAAGGVSLWTMKRK